MMYPTTFHIVKTTPETGKTYLAIYLIDGRAMHPIGRAPLGPEGHPAIAASLVGLWARGIFPQISKIAADFISEGT